MSKGKGRIIKVDSYKRNNPKSSGRHKVRAHFRRPPGKAEKFPKQWEEMDSKSILESIDVEDVEFANERGQDGLHIGEEDQYQHSRFRCPECLRGMGYDDNNDEHFCRVHGLGQSNIAQMRDDGKGVLDTNKIEDLEMMIEGAEMYVEDEIRDGYEPSEQENEQFGGKTMGQSWYDYFTKKKAIIEQIEGR